MYRRAFPCAGPRGAVVTLRAPPAASAALARFLPPLAPPLAFRHFGRDTNRQGRLWRSQAIAENLDQGVDVAVDHASAAGEPPKESVNGPRFPFSNVFDFGRGKTALSAEEVRRLLGPTIVDERRQKFADVVKTRTFNLLPIVEGLCDTGNMAAVCRSAEALGVGHVHVIADPKQRYKQSGRTSGGSEKWLDVRQWSSTTECLQAAKDNGFQIVVTALHEDSVPLSEVDWSVPTAFVLGNELEGISDEAVAMADHKAIIPMCGFVESYNISVAGALVMYHAYLDRMNKLGRHGDLTEHEMDILVSVMFLRHNSANAGIVQRLAARETVDALSRHVQRDRSLRGEREAEAESRAEGGVRTGTEWIARELPSDPNIHLGLGSEESFGRSAMAASSPATPLRWRRRDAPPPRAHADDPPAPRKRRRLALPAAPPPAAHAARPPVTPARLPPPPPLTAPTEIAEVRALFSPPWPRPAPPGSQPAEPLSSMTGRTAVAIAARAEQADRGDMYSDGRPTSDVLMWDVLLAPSPWHEERAASGEAIGASAGGGTSAGGREVRVASGEAIGASAGGGTAETEIAHFRCLFDPPAPRPAAPGGSQPNEGKIKSHWRY